MSQFAEGTSVAPEKSQMEIAALIRKYGAGSFATGWDGPRAVVQFVAHERQVRFVLQLPTDWREFSLTPTKQRRTEVAAKKALEAEVRRRWRALMLVIKAKLEVVASGISTFESEFLPHTVMPDGRTVSQHVLPLVNAAIASGHMPAGGMLAIEGAA